MSRRLPALLLGAALLAPATGCRSSSCSSNSNSCGNRPGLFTSNTNNHPPCTLVGSGTRLTEGCFDAITGQPVPCPPPTSVIPGGTYQPPLGSPRPDELPYPSPSDMIPRPGVPYAAPSPAPGLGVNTDGKGNAAAVKSGTKQ